MEWDFVGALAAVTDQVCQALDDAIAVAHASGPGSEEQLSCLGVSSGV